MDEKTNDKVPLFSKWSHWYILVISFLILLIIFFYFFTKFFS